jgi:hypothetical protein
MMVMKQPNVCCTSSTSTGMSSTRRDQQGGNRLSFCDEILAACSSALAIQDDVMIFEMYAGRLSKDSLKFLMGIEKVKRVEVQLRLLEEQKQRRQLQLYDDHDDDCNSCSSSYDGDDEDDTTISLSASSDNQEGEHGESSFSSDEESLSNRSRSHSFEILQLEHTCRSNDNSSLTGGGDAADRASLSSVSCPSSWWVHDDDDDDDDTEEEILIQANVNARWGSCSHRAAGVVEKASTTAATPTMAGGLRMPRRSGSVCSADMSEEASGNQQHPHHQQQHSDSETTILLQSDSEQHLHLSPQSCQQRQLPPFSFQTKCSCNSANAAPPVRRIAQSPSSSRQKYKRQHQQSNRSISSRRDAAMFRRIVQGLSEESLAHILKADQTRQIHAIHEEEEEEEEELESDSSTSSSSNEEQQDETTHDDDDDEHELEIDIDGGGGDDANDEQGSDDNNDDYYYYYFL